jgi:hypothetical protein
MQSSWHHGAAIVLLSVAGCANEPQVRKQPAPVRSAANSGAPNRSAPSAAVSGETPTKPPAAAKHEIIHPQAGQTDCTEMYGTCTPPPDRICTSTAFVLSCNETGQRPNTNTWLKCVCP